MKVWVGHGSEHSMNLVMIGRFRAAADAAAAEKLIGRFVRQVTEERDAGRLEVGETQARFSDAMREFLRTNDSYSVGPAELEQFLYDVAVERTGNTVELRTDESDVSAFLKVLIDHKARVEVFSAHHYKRAADDSSSGG